MQIAFVFIFFGVNDRLKNRKPFVITSFKAAKNLSVNIALKETILRIVLDLLENVTH